MFLGVDGGGTKTAYALIDAAGRIRARHVGPSVSHLAEGFVRSTELLIGGIGATLAKAACPPASVTFAFIGLPAYGEDSATTATMDAMPSALLDVSSYRCGNDTVCSWAGSLACEDGISVIAGTGSVAYGQYAGREARAGGWGELIGDEGSAYWIAREGLNLFSRMSDGRTGRGPLYELVRARFGIAADLDLCARIYGESGSVRSVFAQFAVLVHEAAQAGDARAAAIFDRAAQELVECVIAVRRSLAVPESVVLPVSHSGGVFNGAALTCNAFRAALEAANHGFEYRTPLYSPELGAALYAARLAKQPLDETALATLREQCSTP
ncbi:MAG TPA: BadF/BadG/BcrA/BcrD ATPase family protein [Steroidobacter sp.]|uniref:N-acetylglucosamine kinase n=1 Tax=Steroidobacter sp. TaxID=1978227 RepID=UPI002EDA563F